MKSVVVLLFITLFSGFPVWSGDNSELPVAIIESQTEVSNFDTPIVSNEVLVEVDPTAFIDDVASQLKPAEPLKKGAYVKMLEKMRDTVPPKLEKVLNFLKVPGHFTKYVLDDFLNRKLTEAPEIITNSDGQVPIFRFHTMAGAGLPEYLTLFLKSKKWGQHLPARVHFGVALNFGAFITSVEHGGKRKVLIRLHGEYESLEKVMTWMLEATAGVAVGMVALSKENLAEKSTFKYRTFTRSSLSLAGDVVIEPGHFEHVINVVATVGIPGGIYDRKVHRLDINILYEPNTSNPNLRQCIMNSCLRLLGAKY